MYHPDIKAKRHEFTWEVICDSIGIASVESPGEFLYVLSIISKCKGCLMQSQMHPQLGVYQQFFLLHRS